MKNKKLYLIASITFLIFIIYTLCVKFIDVSAVGPNGSAVGLSHINNWFHNLTGVNFTLYKIIDYSEFLAFIPFVIFAITGLIQLIKRKNLTKVDSNIIALGILYIASAITYLFFQFVVINFRPVLIDGMLETSYPSSTTVLSLTFMLSLPYQFNCYFKNKKLKTGLKISCYSICTIWAVGRLVSGVHWLTDIVGGLIIGSTILLFYFALLKTFSKNKR